jgi:hypothetical protein
MHRRLRPAQQCFVYPVFYLPAAADRAGRRRKRRVLGQPLQPVQLPLRRPRRARRLAPAALDPRAAAREGVACADGEIWLQCFPRVLGYVFNPVSFWFCHDRGGALRAVLAEVNNTFGERHNYLLHMPTAAPIATARRSRRARSSTSRPSCGRRAATASASMPERPTIRADYAHRPRRRRATCCTLRFPARRAAGHRRPPCCGAFFGMPC